MNNPTGGPRLAPRVLPFPKPDPTAQERVAGQFLNQLSEIEDFAIFAHTRDGRLLLFPCVDREIGVWRMVEACRAKDTEISLEQLTTPATPAGKTA